MEDDLQSGLFNIALSDDEAGDEGATSANGQNDRGGAAAKKDRTAQSEEEYLALKQEYCPKINNGEVWQTIELPLAESVSKPAAQELLHAVEELYFFRRYEEAASFIHQVFGEGNGEALDQDTKRLIKVYERKCLDKLEKQTGQEGEETTDR
ncbi:hypothetical protein GQ53DRAFT_107930 [Thozetella sp. PMI_491]|nr:hypothetical protein GQ53DRAFT_107930 [Thozetella sp. PMI_491]